MKLYHTNDMHSEFKHCAKLKTFFKQHKTENDLYLDAGDFCDLKDICIVGTDGVAGSTLLNDLGCDALCVGNNEADLGLNAIRKIGAELNLLSCNLRTVESTPIENLKESLLITKGGIRFLIIGISPYYRENMQPNGYNIFLELDGMKMIEPVDAIKTIIKNHENQYDCCVLLSHSGLLVDKQLAERCPEVALIVGGHSHSLMKEPIKINDTYIIQSGEYGNFVGCLEFDVADFKIVNVKYHLVSNEMEEDQAFLHVLQDCHEIAMNELNKPIIQNCDLAYDAFKPCPLMDYVCDCLAKEDECDFAMSFHGIMNHGLQGEVSTMSLIQCSPSKLNPTKVMITGKQILKAIQLSQDDDYIHQSGRGPGFRGSVLGTLSFSHHVDWGGSVVKINGVELQETQKYVVIMDDYLQRGTSYPSLATPEGEAHFYKGFIRDCVAKNLKELASK